MNEYMSPRVKTNTYKPKILLVEDGYDTQILVEEALADEYELVFVASVLLAKIAIKQKFDLIILDVMLPDGSGFEFANDLKNSDTTDQIPIIFLSGKAEASDRVHGLKLGADDYICKPFDLMELRARVEVSLRRPSGVSSGLEESQDFPIRFDLGRMQAFKESQGEYKSLDLTPNEFKILKSLFEARGKIMTREDLLKAAWGHRIHVLDRTIDRHVSTLRKKLGRYRNLIESIPGHGYLLLSEKTDKKERNS